MSLYFINEQGQGREWHVGENFSALLQGFWVTSIQADGHELDWIYKTLPDLDRPLAGTRVVTFKGSEVDKIMDVIRPMPKPLKTYTVSLVNTSYLEVQATSKEEAIKRANELLDNSPDSHEEVKENSTGWTADCADLE